MEALRTARSRGQSGFTLVELMMVVGIVAVLSGVTVFAVGNARTNATRNACISEQLAFESASKAASIDTAGDIRSFLNVEVGRFFEASGPTSFQVRASSPLNANCES